MWLWVSAILLFVSGSVVTATEPAAQRPELSDGIGKPLKVFVLAGQSNMSGRRSDFESIAEAFKKPDPMILYFDGEAWLPMAPGMTEPRGGFGPEFSFAKAMQEALGEPIGIIKVANGNTNLADHWHPAMRPRQSRFYRQLVDRMRAAAATRPIEVVGMCWMQGESDAARADYAEIYAENLALLIEDTRTRFNSPEMIFVCGRINSPEHKFPETGTVRRAQETLEAEHYVVVDLDDLSKIPDRLHYDTEGVMEMGRRFATAMQNEMMKGR